MKKLLFIFILCIIGMSCASAGGATPRLAVPTEAKPAIDTAVAITRGLARVGLAAELKHLGTPDAVVDSALGLLHKGVDDILAGRSIVSVVTDPAAYLALHDLACKSLGGILHTAVPSIDEATAELLIGQVLDAAKAFIVERINGAGFHVGDLRKVQPPVLEQVVDYGRVALLEDCAARYDANVAAMQSRNKPARE